MIIFAVSCFYSTSIYMVKNIGDSWQPSYDGTVTCYRNDDIMTRVGGKSECAAVDVSTSRYSIRLYMTTVFVW